LSIAIPPISGGFSTIPQALNFFVLSSTAQLCGVVLYYYILFFYRFQEKEDAWQSLHNLALHLQY